MLRETEKLRFGQSSFNFFRNFDFYEKTVDTVRFFGLVNSYRRFKKKKQFQLPVRGTQNSPETI